MENQLLSLKITFLFLILLLYTPLQAQIRVACIGNSITVGGGIQDREHDSYPAQLQKILGETYEVHNLGVSARTLLFKGNHPYIQEKAYQESLQLIPNIVIIELGTNDSKPQNWKYGDEFEANLSVLVNSYKKLESKPTIFLCRPLPAFEIRYGINEVVLQKEIFYIMKQVAKRYKCKIIDLYTPLSDREVLFPDKIHPNIEGAKIIAEIVANKIKYKV